MTDKMLSVKEAMALTGKSSLTIRNWIKNGKLLGAIKTPSDKEWLIPESALPGYTGVSPSSSGEPVVNQITQDESSDVKKAKDAAEIATSRNTQVEKDIKTKLTEKGYKTIEEGLVDIESKKKDIAMIEAVVQKEGVAIAEQKEKLEEEKEKVANLYTMIREREETINARLEQAIVLEQGQTGIKTQCEILIENLNELIKYHNDNIKPCVRALRVIRRSIYSWIEPLNDTKYDFSILYNHIGRVTLILEKYSDNVPDNIPPDVIPEIPKEETE